MCCSVGVTVLGGANPRKTVGAVLFCCFAAATCPVVYAGVLKPMLNNMLVQRAGTTC